MKINRHIVAGTLATVGIAGSIVLAFKAGTKAERILRDEYGDDDSKFSLLEKAKLILPEAAPVLIVGSITAVSFLIEITGNKKEADRLRLIAQKGVKTGKQIRNQFKEYRQALTDIDGSEKDIQVIKKVSKWNYADESGDMTFIDDEVAHEFCFNWPDEPIYFQSNLPNVLKALAEMNRKIVDYNDNPDGIATIADFFLLIERDDLITAKMKKAGWQRDLLEMEWGCYYLPGEVIKNDNGIYYIEICCGPWDDVNEAYEKLMEYQGI